MQSLNFNLNLNIRRHYNKIESAKEIPDLIEMQKNSYAKFLQTGLAPVDRKDIGLQGALKTIFPVNSADGKCMLEIMEYNLYDPEYDIVESKRRGINYSAPLKLRLRLTTNEINKEIGTVSVKDIQEKEVYLCDLPLMTENGSFIINGTERVIVSQIYRSPGIFFDHDKGKNTYDKLLYSASIIPHVGSWLDIEFDNKDLLYIRIDKRKKISLSALLKSLDSNYTEELKKKAEKESKTLDPDLITGMDNDEILSTFYKTISVENIGQEYKVDFVSEFYKGRKLSFDLKDAKDNSVLVQAGTTISTLILRKLSKLDIKSVIIENTELVGRYLGNTIYKPDTKEVLLYSGTELTEEVLELLKANNISEFTILLIDNINVGPYILNTLLADKIDTREKALNEIYLTVKASEAPSLEAAQELFHNLFFNSARYNLSEVGRVKINERLNNDQSDSLVLEKRDIISIIKVLLQIRDGHSKVDDIDHLGNRRVRSVGELVENEIRIALVRMERYVQEKMNSAIDVSVNDLINVKSVQSTLREFFGSSQLSQFMDQTNPLSEITHKRRLSALGPKGLARDRASFEVRDVHTTHYGRICPIETPEGPNIGLINSLAIFARVNKYGFLETPYRKVVNGVVTNQVEYMNASTEGKYSIAQSTVALDENNRFIDDLISCRVAGDLVLCNPEEVQYIDVSPKQLVSVAASLVPFLENDDANRALMGANMQRQAVPLLKNEAPIVGTGMEGIVAKNSGVVILAKRSGVVHKVDSSRIIILADEEEGQDSILDIYELKKFQRSNHNTCINQSPIVKVGDKVKAGDIITNGNSIDSGELALGKNVLVGFVPWNGYNFEDAILISERVVTDDVFTSIHIEELEVVARDTKLGAEEITQDIPNIGDEAIKNLDESGIISVGADVKPGDILVGKTTPKAESVVTSEEKLLRAIFGEKSVDVKDTSLKVPAGITGTVIDVRVFARRGLTKDSRTQSIERDLITRLSKEREEEYKILASGYSVKARNILIGNEVVSSKKLSSGVKLTEDNLKSLSLSELLEIKVSDSSIQTYLNELSESFDLQISKLNTKFENKKLQMQKGDDLPTGVLKVVKVFIAVKRKLQPGDKMAGRHGNKGVVSKILPIEDMPHLEDGTPVDICLNPLGVPSRMNVGQVLEVHTGWACRNIGQQVENMLSEYYLNKNNVPEIREYLLSCYGNHEKDKITNLSDEEILVVANNIRKGMPVATPVFDGVREKDINKLLDFCNLDNSAQVTLIDGRTGEPFERKVTVGYIYMLKLHHLVDDKIHARSIGPYSLITQQPLGGKAQFGGQRFGEMEVWALESYGAAHILQEMLTVKSDDQQGRVHVYEAIVKGEESFETGIPESFNVLMKELRSLALNLEMKKKEDK